MLLRRHNALILCSVIQEGHHVGIVIKQSR